MPHPAGIPCPKCKMGQMFTDAVVTRLDNAPEYSCLQCGYTPILEPLPYVGNRPELDGHRGRKTR